LKTLTTATGKTLAGNGAAMTASIIIVVLLLAWIGFTFWLIMRKR
jgi:hypothetical protein